MDRRLLLIRHAETRIDPAQPSRDWRLTAQAYAACETLAEGLKAASLSRIITSEEFKASETGRVISEILGIPCEMAPGLHELRREDVPVMVQNAWLATVERVFSEIDQPVLGAETAVEALERFDKAVWNVLSRYPFASFAIVSHATVMSLLVARYRDVDAFSFWQTLKMPDVVRLSYPPLQVVDL